MKLRLALFPLVAVAVVVGCMSSPKSKITEANVRKLKQGMTKAKVVAILGEPTGSGSLGRENGLEPSGTVWQGRSIRIVGEFDNGGKLVNVAAALLTPSPVSLAVARRNCPIPLPDSATNIQSAGWAFWIAHETSVRFQAPTSVCLDHARKVLLDYAQIEAKGEAVSVISGKALTPPEGYPGTNGMLNVPWFDLDRFTGGVVFSLSNHWGPVVWVDTNRCCFYFIDED